MTITFETTKEAKFKHIEMLKFLLERYIGATPIYYKDKNILVKFDNKKFDTDNLIEKIKPGGYIFVGLSETISKYSTKIKQVSPSVYVKIDVAKPGDIIINIAE